MIFNHEDADIMFWRNADIYRRDYTAKLPRITSSANSFAIETDRGMQEMTCLAPGQNTGCTDPKRGASL